MVLSHECEDFTIYTEISNDKCLRRNLKKKFFFENILSSKGTLRHWEGRPLFVPTLS